MFVTYNVKDIIKTQEQSDILSDMALGRFAMRLGMRGKPDEHIVTAVYFKEDDPDLAKHLDWFLMWYPTAKLENTQG